MVFDVLSDLQWLVLREHRPDDPSMFGRDGDARAVVSTPSSDTERPTGEAVGASQSRLQHRSSPHDQQRSKVRIAMRRDASEPGLATGGVLLRGQP